MKTEKEQLIYCIFKTEIYAMLLKFPYFAKIGSTDLDTQLYIYLMNL